MCYYRLKAVFILNYGARLKQLRIDRDLKQSDLAAILDVSTSAIGSYERCERQPTFELLLKYAQYFNVSIDYMLCNSEEKLTVEAYNQLYTLDLENTLANHSVTLDGIELTPADKLRLLDIARVLLFERR
jgi:transcriptional regulator with XRE-family HTH domain